MPKRRRNRTALRALLCIFLLGGGLTACGGDAEPGGQGSEVEECPEESSVRCPDDSCAAEAAQCPGDEEPDEEEPGEISGEIVDMKPVTILAHAPEPVSLMLSVDDAERVQKLVDDGATWKVKLEKGSEAQTLEAAASPAEDADAAHDFVVEFTPDADDGPQRVALTVELAAADDEGKVYSWGKAALSLRGDASLLDFDGRESYAIEGLTNPDRTWGDDLDADGIGDLVVSNLEEDANGQLKSTLHLFKCGADKCEPAGKVRTQASSGEEIVAPEMVVAPDAIDADAPQGFLAAAVAKRSDDGEISSVEAIHIELVEDGDALEVRETRANIDLAAAVAGERLHEQTLEPRLLLDQESGKYRPGVIVTRTVERQGLLRWSTLVVDADGVLSDFNGQRIFEGLDEQQMQAALGGQLAVCSPGDAKTLVPHEAPESMLLSAFELDGDPAIGISYLPGIGGPVQTFILDEYDLDILFGESSGGDSGDQSGDQYGSISCKYGDLDADGFEDLVITVADDDAFARLGAHVGQPASLLLSRGIDKKDLRRSMAAPVTIINGVAADTKGLIKGDRLSLHVAPMASSISKRSARTGRNPQTGKEVRISAEGDLELTDADAVLQPAGIPIHSIDRVDNPEALQTKEGNDRVVRKKPGRTTYANITLERPLTGSTQLVSAEGSLVLAHFGPSIAANDDQESDAILKTVDPDTILDGLGTTGPFLPVEPSSGEGDLDLDELSEILYAPSNDDQTTPLLYQGLVSPRGDSLTVVTGEIILGEDRHMLQNEQRFELDTSEVSLEGKKAVKFKAGAELSKSVNIAAPDDDTDTDCDDTDSCPSPADVLLAFELDTGEILTAVLDTEGDAAPVLQETELRSTVLSNLGLREGGDLSGLRTSLRMGHDGREPIVVLHGIHAPADAPGESDETIVTLNRRGEVSTLESLRDTSTQPVSLFGDVLGEATDQRVVCKSSGDENELICKATHLSAADNAGSEDEWSEAIIAKGDVVCIADLDGDRCGDLVTDAGEYISSRCNGEFEPVAVELGEWAAHLVCGDDGAGPNRAQDYNSSRSNKPRTIAWSDPDDDGDGIDDGGIMGVLPFFDGLEMPRWD